MSVTNYKLTLIKSGTMLKVKYKSGRFNMLQILSGKLAEIQHAKIMEFVPSSESGIQSVVNDHPEKFHYEKIESTKSLLQEFLDLYIIWYFDRNEVEPKLNGVEVNAMKQIIKHLCNLSSDEAEAKGTFSYIMQNWNKLSDFHQNMQEVRQINQHLNAIIRTIKSNVNEEGKYSR